MFDRSDLMRMLTLTTCALLAGCGGGGGGAGNDPANADGTVYTQVEFDPPVLEVSLNEGQPGFASTKMVLPDWAYYNTGNYEDSEGLVDRDGTRSIVNSDAQPTGTRRTLFLQFAFPKVAPGSSRSGTIKLTLVCNRLPGSPQCPRNSGKVLMALPYTLKSVPDSGALKPLKALPGTPAWQGFLGNASQTGYVPADVDASAFSRRFVLPVSLLGSVDERGDRFNHVIAAVGGNAMVSTSWGSILKVSEATGTAALATLTVPNPPNPPDPTVRVRAELLNLYGPDAALVSKMSLPQQNYCRWAQTGVSLYAQCRNTGYSQTELHSSLYRIALGLNLVEWRVDILQDELYDDVDSWPSLLGDTVYVRGPTRLEARSAADGSLRFKVASPAGKMFVAKSSLVVGEDGSVYVLLKKSDPGYTYPYSLARIDPTTRQIDWTKGGNILSHPVLAKGVLYVLDGDRLVALDPRTGRELWAWEGRWPFHTPASAGLDTYSGPAPFIVVGDYAFLSTVDGVRAVDLRTRKVVWGDPSRGNLAVSDTGILYVIGLQRLTAINLQ